MKLNKPKISELTGVSGVYVLHFTTPFGHARHYTGYSQNIGARIKYHRKGQGATLTQAARKAGIDFKIAVVYVGADRAKERRLKNSGSASRYCPLCKRSHS